jgi:NAD-dependent dihydropyrimidine dehydrogenase PreA subunit
MMNGTAPQRVRPACRVERTENMGKPVVDPNLCTACGICVDECPTSALDLEDTAVLARPDDCTECGTCADVCPNEAIELK